MKSPLYVGKEAAVAGLLQYLCPGILSTPLLPNSKPPVIACLLYVIGTVISTGHINDHLILTVPQQQE